MDTLKSKPMVMIATAAAVSLGLSLTAQAGRPMGAIDATHEAMRMSMMGMTRTGTLRGPTLASRPTVAPRTAIAAAVPSTAAAHQKATTATHTTGQPGQTCGSATAPETPGNAANAPGSAFNPSGKAGTVYAGTQPQNSKNPTSVAQYDVACSHQR